MSAQVTILGTGTIIPTPEREATSLVVACGGEPYLFDCGPGTLDALEGAGLSFRELKHVFLTHYHPDHTLGVGHLLAAMRIDDDAVGQGALTFYGPGGLFDFIERWHALYPSTAPHGAPPTLIEIDGGEVYSGGGVEVRAAVVDHDGHPALAYRIEADGASVVYTGDTAFTESLVELARGAGLLIAECSTPDDRPMAGHMTPSVVGRLAARSGVGRVVLVHLYPAFAGRDPAAPVAREFHGPVAVAADGMKIDL